MPESALLLSAIAVGLLLALVLLTALLGRLALRRLDSLVEDFATGVESHHGDTTHRIGEIIRVQHKMSVRLDEIRNESARLLEDGYDESRARRDYEEQMVVHVRDGIAEIVEKLDQQAPLLQSIPYGGQSAPATPTNPEDRAVTWREIREYGERRRAAQQAAAAETAEAPSPTPSEPEIGPEPEEAPAPTPPEPDGSGRFTPMDEIFQRARRQAEHGEG